MRGLLLVGLACGGCDALLRLSDITPTHDAAASCSYVQPFATGHAVADGTTSTFTASAAQQGDAIAMLVGCVSASSTSIPVSVTAPGWTFDQLGATTGQSGLWAASFVAVAPDTATQTFTVTWASSCSVRAELADELGANDPTGGERTFGAHAEAFGNGNCATALTTPDQSDAIWAACFSNTMVLAIGPGFNKGADDAHGDWAEYALTTDIPGTLEAPTFQNAVATKYVIVADTIKPR